MWRQLLFYILQARKLTTQRRCLTFPRPCGTWQNWGAPETAGWSRPRRWWVSLTESSGKGIERWSSSSWDRRWYMQNARVDSLPFPLHRSSPAEQPWGCKPLLYGPTLSSVPRAPLTGFLPQDYKDWEPSPLLIFLKSYSGSFSAISVSKIAVRVGATGADIASERKLFFRAEKSVEYS